MSRLLDLKELRSRDRDGLDLGEDGFFPWVRLGPIELAQYLDNQAKIEEIGTRNTRETVDDARERVGVMRDQLALILPSAPAEVLDSIEDQEVDYILRFFENDRLEKQGDEMEEVADRVEKQSATMSRMKEAGEKVADTSDSVDALNKRLRMRAQTTEQ